MCTNGEAIRDSRVTGGNSPLKSLAMTSRRKVGILTFHRCINYGSYWQARCLAAGFSPCEAVLLNHHSWRVNFAEWKCGLHPVLPISTSQRDFIFYIWKILKFLRAFSTLPLSRHFSLEKPQEAPFFNTVIVGSDEVWNLCHPWYGGYSLFFGEGIRTTRLISYAASFGNYNATRGLEKKWSDWLKRFHAISVRDENSRELIKECLGVLPPLVLDPCLQFPLPLKEAKRVFKKPFVVVYGHSFSKSFARGVRTWAKSHGYQIISIGYRNAWADRQWITAGPEDFVSCIAKAKAVATNFFHGCIFALRYAKPFVVEVSPYRTNKITNLLHTVGGKMRLFSDSTSPDLYHYYLSNPPERQIIDYIGELRKASEAYLNEALA